MLHVALWRGLIEREVAQRSLEHLSSGAVKERHHARLGAESWRIADELNWAKTYDAEYLALATLLGAPVATFDRRLRRAAEHVGVATEVPL